MSTREHAVAFLRRLKAGDEGVTIHQDVIDHVLAALDDAERSERSALDNVDSLTRATVEFSRERAALRAALENLLSSYTFGVEAETMHNEFVRAARAALRWGDK